MTESSDTFTFDFRGRQIAARAGDTVASALYRAGQRIFTRSFKYHRPRGLLCLSGKCPNCLMNVDGVPNVRACVTPARAGMRVRHQNASPSLEHDRLAIVQRFDWLMPVGWYYKTLTHPVAWHAAERFIRQAAGLGDPPPPDARDREYEHSHRHADVAIVGGGPAGLQAAVDLAPGGGRIMLIDDQPALGGHLRYSREADAVTADLIARIRALPNVEVLQGAYCFGLYEGTLLGVLQPNPHPGAVERLIHLRAGRVLVATGVYEAPLLFPNNDLVGIMLSSAVQRLVRLHDIVPGRVAAVIGAGPQADAINADLRAAGMQVAATVPAESVLGAAGNGRVTGLDTRDGPVGCDLVVMCGHRLPDAGLLSQAGGRLEWDPAKGAFIAVDLPSNIAAVGEVTGASLVAAAPHPPTHGLSSKRAFVCLCSDVSAKDIEGAIGEGFDHIETVKRYTTATMGPCQGRMCQLSTIGVCAAHTQRGMEETGTTTARPPFPSVTLGALAGARHHPVRRTPMHYEHAAQGAVWMDMGEWKRPRYYTTGDCTDEHVCVEAEYRAVRERVGLIDVGTLGKLDVQGRDAAKLLDKVYAGRLSDLRPGRTRYALMCDDAGIMLDDGTASRLAADHYFITTTTGNLDFVQQWLEWWLIGSGWDVHITNVTGGLAAVNLAGPNARDVLAKLTACDLTTKGFPYMACRQASVAGVDALLMRIGFVGETGWEMHFAGESGPDVWNALLEAGREFDIRPFGVEAQRLLRLEKRHVIVGVDTDALSTPYEAGMGWIVKLDREDFIGRAALQQLSEKEPVQNLVGFIMNGGPLPGDGAAIVVDGKLAGRVTSARYSPANRQAVGLAWVATAHAREGAEVDVRVDGRLVRAQITQRAFYDPEGARLRM